MKNSTAIFLIFAITFIIIKSHKLYTETEIKFFKLESEIEIYKTRVKALEVRENLWKDTAISCQKSLKKITN